MPHKLLDQYPLSEILPNPQEAWDRELGKYHDSACEAGKKLPQGIKPQGVNDKPFKIKEG